MTSNSHDESSQTQPDTEMPEPNGAFFYLVRFQAGPVRRLPTLALANACAAALSATEET